MDVNAIKSQSYFVNKIKQERNAYTDDIGQVRSNLIDFINRPSSLSPPDNVGSLFDTR